MESIIVKTEKQLNDAFFVRKEVFVKEQHVPEEEEIDQFLASLQSKCKEIE